ncbi:MAG: hypothetical protein V4699_03755 [Patescibacteria group bacterium]
MQEGKFERYELKAAIGKEGESQDKLKELVKVAWEGEVVAKEKELGRKLSQEEKNEIKITQESLGRWHRQGLVPHPTTLGNRFGSIAHLASLIGLSSGLSKPRVIYYASNMDEYATALRSYIKKHGPTRNELLGAVRAGRVPGVSEAILKHLDYLGLDKVHKGGSTQNNFSDAELQGCVKNAFEVLCQREAKRLGKDSLSEEERKKVVLKRGDYELLVKDSSFTGPSANTLIKRFGPYWDNVLKKSGLTPKYE